MKLDDIQIDFFIERMFRGFISRSRLGMFYYLRNYCFDEGIKASRFDILDFVDKIIATELTPSLLEDNHYILKNDTRPVNKKVERVRKSHSYNKKKSSNSRGGQGSTAHKEEDFSKRNSD